MEATLHRRRAKIRNMGLEYQDTTGQRIRWARNRAALTQSGLSSEQCMALENAPLGVESAKAAGLRTVAITTTLPPKYLHQADHVIHKFADFLNLLDY